MPKSNHHKLMTKPGKGETQYRDPPDPLEVERLAKKYETDFRRRGLLGVEEAERVNGADPITAKVLEDLVGASVEHVQANGCQDLRVLTALLIAHARMHSYAADSVVLALVTAMLRLPISAYSDEDEDEPHGEINTLGMDWSTEVDLYVANCPTVFWDGEKGEEDGS